ncbi:lysM domain receptor-like kinase 3 [Prosopis cineraria]|uniref:lysM domain receptor-like kinase 3 n=1 Tax=Prosopis cineraria TaxID=364024 RepID=UPI00240FA2A5|nr:lysM domain receptor-like kinase 3 [Prosopis cineraria]
MTTKASTKFLACLSFLILIPILRVEAYCISGCKLALASYYVWQGANLTYISEIFGQKIPEILKYNPTVPNPDYVPSTTRINLPFTCDCLNGVFLGHTFTYSIQPGDTYRKIAQQDFSNLTTEDWLERVNSYEPSDIPENVGINVTVNCSCGNRHVSRDYGLFLTYPLQSGDTLSKLAAASGVPAELIQTYNPASDFNAGSGLVFLPAKDDKGSFLPLQIRSGISGGAIAGISAGAVFGALLLALVLYVFLYRSKKVEETSLLPGPSEDHQYLQIGRGSGSSLEKASESGDVASPRLTGITVDKSVEFSYEELAKATNGFSMSNKIGQGGFGSVYYAELRDEKAAIKKMDMQASKEFLAELKVLTHVHHLNLVRLIGYCVESSLFLVYEYIENGNLGHHLRGSGREPLSWSTRVQIALDAARGLEYIHEHTVPVYIHRDIKSANILIDKNFRGKVADFGLTKLAEYGSSSLLTRLVGTFGYMPPEYAQYGDVSPKIDVYAFGVVLYELISGKEAIVKTNELVTESRGLVALFEEVLTKSKDKEGLCKLVDPRLGDDYPFESVYKMAQLAKACAHENPQLRPSMRSIVVALMTLSSSTEDWDVGSFYETQAMMHLVAGR